MRITFRDGEFVAVGNTYPHREALKAAGFRWNPVRRLWHTAMLGNIEPVARWLDDAAKARIAELERRIDESRAAAADLDVPIPDGLTPYPFQLAGVRYALRTLAEGRGVLIADEMGLGKTVQAVLIANALRPQRVTIVCPASVKLNWVHEWKRWSTLPLTVGVVTSNDVPDADVLVVNYDIVNRHVERLACDLLIVDEAHYIKNERSQRARAVKAIRAKHRIYMTGTPIMNRPVELWSLVHDLDPAVFSDFFRFARRYCDAKQVPAGRRLVWDFSGASNLDELHRLLRQRIMIRRLKADVLNELPPKVRQVVHLDVDDRIARLIQLEREALEEARLDAEVDAMLRRIEEGGADEWLDAVERLVDVTSSIDHIARIRHQLATAKVPQAVAYIEDVLASAPQVVVFAHHRDVVSALCERLQPYGVVSIVGGDNAEARQEAVERFQRGEASVFVGSITAAGTGITLTKADTVVFVELDWVPANVLQAEDRCHRIGQRDSVFVYYLVVDGSLDARMARALARKLDLVREAVG